MKLENFISAQKILAVSGLFFATGSFGVVDGDVDYVLEEKNGTKEYVYSNGVIELKAQFIEKDNGVVIRRDTFKNLTDKSLFLNCIASRFRLKGNRYQAYTQFNGWEHESKGEWQNLVTEVSCASRGIRSCDGATPMMALFDEYSQKSIVFHLIPNAQWKISAKKLPIYNNRETVVVETGFNCDGLNMEVFGGEVITLPEVIFYQADSKIDFDCYKLHEVYNQMNPRKNMPVLYNSWLYCFDMLDVDELLVQVDVAKELGIEAFMIDAGWFGKGLDWFACAGDWVENTTGGPKGRLIEIANKVHQNGMLFGLWFEPERCGALSEIKIAHPEYFIEDRFLDFTSEKAREYIVDSISSQIDKYNIDWLKFDFNDTIPYDKTGSAFYRYLQGQKLFIQALKEKYPNIYITNCASGGYRMDTYQGSFCDSFWLSDNQGPIEGVRIVKDTIKRLPSSLIERWCVQKYSDGFLQWGKKEKVGRMLYCNNATWDQITTVTDNFAKAFMTGGPIGFSCDINSLPLEYKEFWKEAISQFKQDRQIYINGTARVLIDNNSAFAIEYADIDFDKCILQIFTQKTYLTDIILYPVVDESAEYRYNETTLSGREIIKNGITIDGILENDCRIIRLEKVKD